MSARRGRGVPDLADGLRAIGTRQAGPAANLTAALNAAYDALLTVRSAASGRMRGRHAPGRHPQRQPPDGRGGDRAAASGERPPPWVTDTIDRLADAIAAHPGPVPFR